MVNSQTTTMNDSNCGSLVVVGSGIKCISHLTVETQSYIRDADKVLYLINEPAMMEWIRNTNDNSESLEPIYFGYTSRQDAYNAITDYILENLEQKLHLCVVIYGHPCVFAQSTVQAVIQAKQKQYNASILPAVSAADCLYADLCIDPSSSGCQSFETTDFLIYARQFDPSSHLLLWQVGVIGVLGQPGNHNNSQNAQILVDHLTNYYPAEHNVILYEAAQYPTFGARIDTVTLAELAKAHFTEITTLYIPPACKKDYDHELLMKLTGNVGS